MSAAKTIKLADLSTERRLSALRDAAMTVRDGGVCIAAMEGEYVALALDPSAISDRLSHSLGVASWWAASPSELAAALPQISATQHRLTLKLAPARVLWRVALSEDTKPARPFGPAILPSTGARRVHVRLADTSAASAIASQVKDTLTSGSIALWSLTKPDGQACRDADDALAVLDRLPVIIENLAAINSGTSTAPMAGLTIIDLNAAGGIHVEREGSYERRSIMAQSAINILLVCTGNTCRSPMAEAIGAGLVRQLEPSVPVRFSSAGVSASAGEGATPEAIDAVRELGFTMQSHRSRPVTRQLIESADIIFTMTRGHLHAVLAIDPSAQSKAFLLDPAGDDVPDPFGQGARVYTVAAERIKSLLEARLKEFAP